MPLAASALLAGYPEVAVCTQSMKDVQDMHVRLSKEAQGWLIVCCGFFVEALALGGRSVFLVVLLIFEKDPDMHWTRSELSALVCVVCGYDN